MSPSGVFVLVKSLTVASTFAAAFLSASLSLAQSKGGEWDKIVEAAKKEGKVVASIPPTPELRKLMEIAFSRRYGIATEFVPARGGAVVQRIVSEAKAGVQYFDLRAAIALNPTSEMLPICLRFFRGTPFDPPRAVIRNNVFTRQ